jgi:hypothetical protein
VPGVGAAASSAARRPRTATPGRAPPHPAQPSPFLDAGDFMMFHRRVGSFAVGSLYTTREHHALAQLRDSVEPTGLSTVPKSRRFATDLSVDALELIEFAWMTDDSLIISCRRLRKPLIGGAPPPDREESLAIKGDILFYDIIPPDHHPTVPLKRMTLDEKPVECVFCGSRGFHRCKCPPTFKRRAPSTSFTNNPSRKLIKRAADSFRSGNVASSPNEPDAATVTLGSNGNAAAGAVSGFAQAWTRPGSDPSANAKSKSSEIDDGDSSKTVATVSNFKARLFSIDQSGSFFVRWSTRVPGTTQMRAWIEPRNPIPYQFLCGTRDQTNVLAALFINDMNLCTGSFISDTRFYSSLTNGSDIGMLVSKNDDKDEGSTYGNLGGHSLVRGIRPRDNGLPTDFQRPIIGLADVDSTCLATSSQPVNSGLPVHDYISLGNNVGRLAPAAGANCDAPLFARPDSAPQQPHYEQVFTKYTEPTNAISFAARVTSTVTALPQQPVTPMSSTLVHPFHAVQGSDRIPKTSDVALSAGSSFGRHMASPAALVSEDIRRGSIRSAPSVGTDVSPAHSQFNQSSSYGGQQPRVSTEPSSLFGSVMTPATPQGQHFVSTPPFQQLQQQQQSYRPYAPHDVQIYPAAVDLRNPPYPMQQDQHQQNYYPQLFQQPNPLQLQATEVGAQPGGQSLSPVRIPSREQGADEPQARVILGADGISTCSECHSTFRKASNAARHIASVHEKRKPFACAQCPSRFGYKTHLRRHELSVRTFYVSLSTNFSVHALRSHYCFYKLLDF